MASDTLSDLNVDELVAVGHQVESALATQPDLAAALAPHGYDAAALAAVGAALDALEAAAQVQRNQCGLPYEAADGERGEALHAWAAQVRRFYGVLAADAGLRTRLAARGVSAAALTAASARLAAFAVTEQGREHRRGLAQQATPDHDTPTDAFERWIGGLRDTARVAFRARPSWLARLGFPTRSDEG